MLFNIYNLFLMVLIIESVGEDEVEIWVKGVVFNFVCVF